ncbi:TetR/AcrR family transcriptional regulator [Mycolicibacterium sp. 120266]|uniref:TetR/AcrR family transcriptional regulator n=1 Tax=Mycolicibacterium sp. 120266 TaxID=3090601 RepID=UPI00299D97BF|nr:TetR/AcrR family transcriptional regulator [Mycolicibacterium sp. 120266]MDX1873015.1 TetR/AcrR family transcriptional regulator [Mycolicibacterium sp. 120266]
MHGLQIPEAMLRRIPRQVRSRERLAHVLTTADQLLAMEGPEALTTTRVAAEAGMSVGAVYQYLPDRDAIIEALATSYLARIEVTMASFVAAATEQRWADPVGALVDGFAQVYRSETGFRALWFGRHLTEATRSADREHKKRMAAMLRELVLAQRLVIDGAHLPDVCRAAHLIADTLLQEAFRADPEGDAALLREAKTALRGYLAALAAPTSR